ncbi:murein L,D-transpeptidase [Candidatus Woesearchaeota archaeon]|nr:murein L,D-transpeptidase [Candidatus Woesearchaeota archaeon]
MGITQDITRYASVVDKLEESIKEMENLPRTKDMKRAYKDLKIRIEIPKRELEYKDVESNQRVSQLHKVISSAEHERPLSALRRLLAGSEHEAKLSYAEAKIRLNNEVTTVEQLAEMQSRFEDLETRANACYDKARQRSKDARWHNFTEFFTKERSGTRLLYSAASMTAAGLIAGTIAYQAGLKQGTVEQITIHYENITPVIQEKAPKKEKISPHKIRPYEAPMRRATGLPNELQDILELENLSQGSKYILIDKEQNKAYAGRVGSGVEHILDATTGINPGDRTARDQGTTPSGAFYIKRVVNTKGLGASSGVKDAYGSTAAILDTKDGRLKAIWGDESDIWLHSQPAWQDEFLGNADFSAGCPHVSEEGMQLLKQDGYIKRGVMVGISGHKEWTDLSDSQRRNLYTRLYRAFVSLEPGRTPNEDISKFGADPIGFRELTKHLVNNYRTGHEGGA